MVVRSKSGEDLKVPLNYAVTCSEGPIILSRRRDLDAIIPENDDITAGAEVRNEGIRMVTSH